MVVADLHVHTTNSDGSLTLEQLPEAAHEAEVETVAVTDHDRLHPDLDAPVIERGGVTIVHGIELRVEAPTQRLDLLGYGVEPTDALTAEIDRLQRDRVERGRAMIERVEAHLGIELDVEARKGIGRPHIARAIERHPDAPYDVNDAFIHLIGNDGLCYVARDVPSVDRGERLLKDSCALVALAHPLRCEDPTAAIEAVDDVDAIERWYPYEGDVDPESVSDAIDRRGLLPTGGSDAHGDVIGTAGVPADAFPAIRERLPEARSA